ncbi:MAG TPA: response regulator [Haliscomenobacter sp.]|uniref:response regulator n=1 Tax=Haliscomenobacter sp. TaxID=2717303 RepID=UPI002B7F15E5|nr:response regulator [Haliscomenobacter sp.]HOY17404.1 response regulator [Haliscomenobacter sp.]
MIQRKKPKKKLKFIWIDDTPQRRKSADNMSKELNIDVDFCDLKNKNVNSELQSISSKPEPDLVLMDHSLDQADGETTRSGSSAAAILRENWHACPIVSITGTDIIDMDTRHRSAYEAIFQYSDISRSYPKIMAIAKGFSSLKQKPPTTIKEVLDHLNVPEDERVRIIKILPGELKDNFNNKSLLLEIYRWCESILFKRPGFLYDRLWASTLLGLNLDGFKQVEAKFNSAKYQGVFTDHSDERWWKSELLSILGEEVDQVGLPWVMGRALVDNKKDYFSKCYVNQEEFPETVAAVDATNDAEWHPMKLKYTDPHPIFEDMLFFEELRMMKAAE